MARMARVVVPHYPHHVTQRGNRRLQTFFSDEDYQAYIDLFVAAKFRAGIEVWAYCLMPNHVHFVLVPEHEDSMSAFFGEAQRRYTRMINFREGWRGHLWQGRFNSFVMDETYLLATVRYTELNPVRAGLCKQPEQWKWSSAIAHLEGEDDALVTASPMLKRISNWSDFLGTDVSEDSLNSIRKHSSTGRPGGTDAFIDDLEAITSRSLRKRKSGPKKRVK
jgi:putative transposase